MGGMWALGLQKSIEYAVIEEKTTHMSPVEIDPYSFPTNGLIDLK
jgi:hypothetical protein